MHDSSAFSADPELIRDLEKRSKPMSLDCDRILFRQGDPPSGIFILKTGTAVITMKSGKKIVMQVQAEGGSLLGLPAVLGDVPYTLTADVLEGSEVAFLPKDDFTHLMQSDPLLSFKVLQLLATQVRFARKALSQV